MDVHTGWQDRLVKCSPQHTNGFNSIYIIDLVTDNIQLCGEPLRVRVLCEWDEGQMFEVVWRSKEISPKKSKWTTANWQQVQIHSITQIR